MTTSAPSRIYLAAALDGAGWHPAAWRDPGARPGDLLRADYWAGLVLAAEQGLLDFVTFEDDLGRPATRQPGPAGRTDRVRGRLDAVLTAARVAPLTSHIGLIPTVIATHTEPFHTAKAIATLDYVATGRAGLRVRISADRQEAGHFGRRTLPPPAARDTPAGRQLTAELLGEAADYVEVIRRLWDSWEDDAEIRDAATGRFVDRDKLHYIDFSGPHFSVRGPSITPRPPQGQPLVAALAHGDAPYRLVASCADLGFVTPHDAAGAGAAVAAIRAAERAAGRAGEPARVLADLVVFLDERPGAAAARRGRLDDLAGPGWASDAATFAGTPAELADLLQDWQAAGLAGFRLRPGVLPHDLAAITTGLVPELQRRGAFPGRYEPGTLRDRFGLPRPANRYTAPQGRS